MINNFNTIKQLLNFEDPDMFYFVQIFKRRKDNPDLEKDMIIIDNYYIYSMEQLDEAETRIVQQCMINNARAYIRLNRRSARKVAMKTLSKVTELISNEQYKDVKRCYTSACGEVNSEENKNWVLDLDGFNTEEDHFVQGLLGAIEPEGPKVIASIPTKNGHHLITVPFNTELFKQKYYEIWAQGKPYDIHRDNPTILFCP